MDAPAAFGHRHALDAVDAAFELELGEHAGAGDIGDDFLEAADIVGVGADHLDPPALLGGIALVHAVEVGREQRRLVAAGAGADFEHGRALIGRIARQHGDGERALGLGQFGLEPRDLLLGQRAHFGIGIVRSPAGSASSPRIVAHLARRARHRLQLGIVAAGGDEVVAFQRARSEPRFQLGKARGDLGEAGVGDGHRAGSDCR